MGEPLRQGNTPNLQDSSRLQGGAGASSDVDSPSPQSRRGQSQLDNATGDGLDPVAKAQKFHHMQLRSVLDISGAAPDDAWAKMLASGAATHQVATTVRVSLPETRVAENQLLDSIDHLADSFTKSSSSGAALCRHFGWEDPASFFRCLGEAQVMIVDVDHNDLDDRVAIIMIAFLMASANVERWHQCRSNRCTLLLDARTYERSSPLSTWRTLRLASRINAVLRDTFGVAVQPVFTDPSKVLQDIAAHLGVPAESSALDGKVPDTGGMLVRTGWGAVSTSIVGCLQPRGSAAVWLIGGLSAKTVQDLAHCAKEEKIHFSVFEQAAPAWQSVDLSGPSVASLQPHWTFPPDDKSVSVGFGAEPSNIRSSCMAYPDTISTYMQLQQLVAEVPERFSYVCPALARHDSYLPVPPGQSMLKVAGRPLTVKTGQDWVVKNARDQKRAQEVFSKLINLAREHARDSVYAELTTGTEDDFGLERPELHAVRKNGSFLADALIVCLAARPTEQLGGIEMTRRLAFVRTSPKA
mmetsp:Transcript_22816/g.52179  ORF Transcript_22816/g.52179 Transcript_22816/m.52179 type:complete len:525 (-) Transcript_22816:60-1634(-)